MLHYAERQLYYLSGSKAPSCALLFPATSGKPTLKAPGGTGTWKSTAALRLFSPARGRRCGTHCAGSRAPGARPAAASRSPAPSAPAPAPPSGSPAGTARRQPRHRSVPHCAAPSPARAARPGTSRMSWSWPSAPCSSANISLTDMLPPLPAHGAFHAAGARLPHAPPDGAALGCPAHCLSGRSSPEWTEGRLRECPESADRPGEGRSSLPGREFLAPAVSVSQATLPAGPGGDA